jgi:glucosamine--fructose-6-phosphate aminotransferase (isomerizing)
LALLLIAIRTGEVKGNYTMDRAMAMRQDILDQADALKQILPDADSCMSELARSWHTLPAWDFTGAGSDYATAWYGHAKVLEATGLYAMHINSEEWLHLNFFARTPQDIATVVIASSSNEGLSRTRETIGYMRTLKRPLLIVSDKMWEDFDTTGLTFVTVPSSAFADSISLVQHAPINLLVGYIMSLLGETPGRGCAGPWSFAKDGAGVRNSEIILY